MSTARAVRISDAPRFTNRDAWTIARVLERAGYRLEEVDLHDYYGERPEGAMHAEHEAWKVRARLGEHAYELFRAADYEALRTGTLAPVPPPPPIESVTLTFLGTWTPDGFISPREQ